MQDGPASWPPAGVTQQTVWAALDDQRLFVRGGGQGQPFNQPQVCAVQSRQHAVGTSIKAPSRLTTICPLARCVGVISDSNARSMRIPLFLHLDPASAASYCSAFGYEFAGRRFFQASAGAREFAIDQLPDLETSVACSAVPSRRWHASVGLGLVGLSFVSTLIVVSTKACKNATCSSIACSASA